MKSLSLSARHHFMVQGSNLAEEDVDPIAQLPCIVEGHPIVEDNVQK